MCDSLEQQNEYYKSRVERALQVWKESIHGRNKRVDAALKEWELHRQALEGIIGVDGDKMLERAKTRLNTFLSENQKTEIERRRTTIAETVAKELIASDPTYREYMLNEKNLRASWDKIELEMKQMDKWSVADLSETSDQAKQQLQELKDAQLGAIQKSKKDMQDRVDREVEYRMSQLASTMVMDGLSKVGDLDASAQEYKNRMALILQKIQSNVTKLHEAITEAASETDHLENYWRKLVQDSAEELMTECRKAKDMKRVLSQTDDDFVLKASERFKNKFFMNPPPKWDDPAAMSSCNDFTPTKYQLLVQEMFNPKGGIDTKGLLVFHDMGTGKTCTIDLVVETLFDYYTALDQDKNLDEALVPCAMILIQNTTNLTAYNSTVTKGCTSMKGRLIDWKRQELKGDEARVARMFMIYDNGRPVLRVVIQKMSLITRDSVQRIFSKGYAMQEGSTDYCNNPIKYGRLLPHRGVVIIDEAHNLINSTEIAQREKNATLEFIDELRQRRDLPLLLGTGTPVMDDRCFADIVRLMDLVRRPCNATDLFSPDMKYDNGMLTNHFFRVRETINVDVDGDDDDVEDTKQQKTPRCGEAVTETKIIEKIEGKVCVIKPKKQILIWDWKEGMENNFKDRVGKYVSFMSLANDPTRFARRVSRFPLKTTSNTKNFTVHASVGAGTDYKNIQFVNFTEETTDDQPFVNIHVPTHPDQWMQMNRKNSCGKSMAFGKSTSRQNASAAIPHKWLVLAYLLTFYNKYKHFIFHPVGGLQAELNSGYRGRTGPVGLINFMKNTLECNEVAYTKLFDPDDINREIEREQQISVDNGEDRSEEKIVLQRRIDQWFNDTTNTPMLRCAMLVDPTTSRSTYYIARDNRIILGIYNDERNKYGEYIRYLLATGTHKEGIDSFHTSCIHIMQPMQSVFQLNQATARISRNCGFKNFEGDRITNWLTTAFVYIAGPPSSGAATGKAGSTAAAYFEQTFAKPRKASLPTELALKALEESALDCTVFHSFMQRGGKRQCYLPNLGDLSNEETKIALKNGYCFDPTGKAKPMVIGIKNVNGGIASVEECMNKQMIPGGLLVYTESDELLYKLLSNYGYTPVALMDARMIDRFESMAQARVIQPMVQEKSFFNVSSIITSITDKFNLGIMRAKPDLRMRLTLSSEIPVAELIRWIRFNPPQIGNSIMYILQEKRKNVSADAIAKIEERVRPMFNVLKLVDKRQKDIDGLLLDVQRKIGEASSKVKEPLEALSQLMRSSKDKWSADVPKEEASWKMESVSQLMRSAKDKLSAYVPKEEAPSKVKEPLEFEALSQLMGIPEDDWSVPNEQET
jgi:hypothetical protein